MTNRNKLIWVTVGLIVLWTFYYSFSGGDSDPNYVLEITNGRMAKDQSFRRDADSPFKGSEFSELKYYPVDPIYRAQASLEILPNPERIFLQTNDGEERQYQEFAWAHFTISGDRLKLMVLRPYPTQDKEQFFLPFGDKTSAVETYGGGRYIDLEFKPGASRIEIDFNLAYSPYCAYDSTFSCPLPPVQNLLNVAINAGEKNYE